VRVGGDAKQTRFVIDLSRKVDLRTFTLADPYRVVIDLPQMTGSITTEQMIRWNLGIEELEAIARANLDGTGVNNSFIRAPGLFSGEVPNLCAHDATYLYWTDVALDLVQPGSSTTRWVGRTSLDGTDVRPHFMSVESPTGCAVGPP